MLKAGKLLLKQKEGEDAVVLQNKLDRAQQMWDSVCQKSVDRQQKLQVRKRSKRARVKVQRSKAIGQGAWVTEDSSMLMLLYVYIRIWMYISVPC